MKKTVVLLVVAMIMNVTFVSAKILNPRKNYTSTTQELTELLNPSVAMGVLENDVQVKVKVLVTETGELVVLQTVTENVDLSNYIKETLNYKKLSSSELTPGKEYVFEVKFKA
ncbi:hypothetical protein [Flavobacterium faecale]|uniref:hypothetical protein n=1 Tax=Flavobacterium faecale TaxID=1355330 RepID=UPI003AAD6686